MFGDARGLACATVVRGVRGLLCGLETAPSPASVQIRAIAPGGPFRSRALPGRPPPHRRPAAVAATGLDFTAVEADGPVEGCGCPLVARPEAPRRTFRHARSGRPTWPRRGELQRGRPARAHGEALGGGGSRSGRTACERVHAGQPTNRGRTSAPPALRDATPHIGPPRGLHMAPKGRHARTRACR